MTKAVSTELTEEPCPHEWAIENESFPHEFGTEVIIFSSCKLCGETKQYEETEYEKDDFDIFDYEDNKSKFGIW